MSFEKIEREIEFLEIVSGNPNRSKTVREAARLCAKSHRLMLDVVRAAEDLLEGVPGEHEWCGKPHKCSTCEALTALREHCEPERDYITMVDGGEGA